MERTTEKYILPSKNVYAKFRKFFGTDLANFKDTLLMGIGLMSTGKVKFSFDVFKFDKYCQGLGYSPEKDGSLRDFVTKRFGTEASKLVEGLLKFDRGGGSK